MERNRPKRIHIIGSIGSGKTTVARLLSSRLNIPYFELDNVVWQRFATGDIRRTEEERDTYLRTIIDKDSWIVEGVHHKWVAPSFQNADVILFLDTKMRTRQLRIIKRFFKQKVGREKANYKPNLKILRVLYNYNTVFEIKSKAEILEILRPHHCKLIVLNTNKEINNALNTWK